MRERDRFGAELRDLSLGRESEYPDFAREGEARPYVKIILVAGLDYPRYDEEPEPDPKPAGWKPKWWVLRAKRKAPLRYPEGLGKRVSSGACLLADEKSLKYDGNVISGSLWRLRCLRLAVQKLRANPDVEVYLYDLDKGLEELISIDGGKLVARPIRIFMPLRDEDYRVVVPVMGKDAATGEAKVERWRLLPITGDKFPLSGVRPYVRLFPFIHQLSDKEIDYVEWTRERAQNAKWLAQYVKSSSKSRYLGVTDFYYHVEHIGKHRPYSLHELHLFGHASSSAYSPNSGTAFVNTDHVEVPGKPDERNPLDLDARATLDFNGKTIDEKTFRMAFAKGARTYVWGCNWSRPLYDLIRQANDQLASKKLTDTMKLRFRWRKGTGGDASDFRKLMKIGPKDKTEVAVEGKFLRERLEGLVADTYMQRIADTSSRCAIGGLPGTYSEYDDRSEKKTPCLLHIPMGSSYYGGKQYLTPILQFYEKHLGTSFDPEGAHASFGRGFALFCPRV